MRIDFDFGDLEAFLAVQETGSFQRAAERLNLSQSAITRRVQKLEAALGSALFERTTRAVRPTLAAKRLRARAEAILEDARQTTLAMRDESAALMQRRNAVVTVATIPTVVPILVIPAIAAFRERGHAARIALRDAGTNAVAEAVAKGEADFGLCPIPALEANTAFEPLFDDPLVLAMPKGHALAGRGAVRWADLAGEALILPARGTGNRLLIDEAMAGARLPLDWTYAVSRSTTALSLVAEGVGVALLPRSALTPGAAGTVFRAVAEPEIRRPVGLLRRIGQRDGTEAAARRRSALAAVQAAVDMGGDVGAGDADAGEGGVVHVVHHAHHAGVGEAVAHAGQARAEAREQGAETVERAGCGDVGDGAFEFVEAHDSVSYAALQHR